MIVGVFSGSLTASMPGRCSWSTCCSPAAAKTSHATKTPCTGFFIQRRSCTEKKGEQGNREMGKQGEWEMANGNAETRKQGQNNLGVPIRPAPFPCSPVQERVNPEIWP